MKLEKACSGLFPYGVDVLWELKQNVREHTTIKDYLGTSSE